VTKTQPLAYFCWATQSTVVTVSDYYYNYNYNYWRWLQMEWPEAMHTGSDELTPTVN